MCVRGSQQQRTGAHHGQRSGKGRPGTRPLLALFAAVTVFAASSCATTTRIVSDPEGAQVLDKDKKVLGTTPYDYTTKEWIWEGEKLTLKKGDATKEIEIKRSEVDLAPMIGGVCLTLLGPTCIVGIPLILAGGMKAPAETKVEIKAEGKSDKGAY
jgi:hypothetical protein